jgi:hypothetical protein
MSLWEWMAILDHYSQNNKQQEEPRKPTEEDFERAAKELPWLSKAS